MQVISRLSLGVLAGLLALGSFSQPISQAQELRQGPSKIYLSSTEFPTARWSQSRPDPVQRTQFLKELDRAFQATGDLALTNNLESADYQVHLFCGGVVHCSKLKLEILNDDRLTVATVKFNGRKFPWQKLDLEETANAVSEHLSERIARFDEGGYGHYDQSSTLLEDIEEEVLEEESPE